ncbi:MAG: hypothetical protein WD669_09880 [Pirellulales bacterium]
MPATPPTKSSRADSRPAFMATLGLLPPYTVEDVEQAYLAKVKDIRPAGDADQSAFYFYGVQQAYEQAREYVKFHGDRRGWIAKRTEEYVVMLEVARRLRQFGAEVETDSIDWLEHSIGDFAELTESIVGIRLSGVANADEAILYMVHEHPRLLALRRLDLSGSIVSDDSVRQLSVFRRLQQIDLSRTAVTWEVLYLVDWLPELVEVRVEGTRLNWLTRQRLAHKLRRKRKAAAALRLMHPSHVR